MDGVILVPEWGFILAFLWGAAIALHMRKWHVGRFMARHMMWFIVACGAGVDLLIVRFFYTSAAGYVDWDTVVIVFFLSSLVISIWSIIDLATYLKDMMDGYRSE